MTYSALLHEPETATDFGGFPSLPGKSHRGPLWLTENRRLTPARLKRMSHASTHHSLPWRRVRDLRSVRIVDQIGLVLDAETQEGA